jgi:hypothetical protein
MSDINKGYTFTDKSTDWASNKETAIRLNKMLDDAKVNLVAGANITITPTANGPSISASGGGTGTVTAVTGTAPIVSTGGTTPAISINAATTSASGSMSAADKSKLDGIANGAQVNVPTNLAQGTRTTTTVPVTSSTGTTATLDIATGFLAGVMSSADKAKLDGIAANANNYSLPKATSTVLGGVELFSDTVQTVAANAVTTTSARTYGVQLNATDQMVVNVPWIDSTFANQTEKTFFAGPTSGAAAAPTFRTIASTDLPAFGSGDVSFAIAGGVGTIAADAVSNAKLADMAAQTVKVNATAGAANPTDLSVGTNTVVGRVAGNIVADQVATSQIADNAVTFAKLQDGVANTVIARAASTNGDVAGVALAASQLLGRGPAGDIAAISLGTNLSITGTTLNTTGSGGGIADGATLTTGLTFPIAGLHILDTDASHDLIISPGDNLTADRTLTITTGDANRTITLTGNTTLTGTNTGDQTNISGNAATVTTNANLTGPITSVGNTTSVASQTGTGSTFVMQASPTLTTPALGTPTSGLLNSCTSNPNATGATARTFQARAGDVFNVKDYTSATEAITALNAAGGGRLYFPAGSYSYTSALPAITKSCLICGDGVKVTVINFAGIDGFVINYSSARGSCELTSLTIKTSDSVVGATLKSAIKFTQVTNTDVHDGFKFHDFEIEGRWGYGINVISAFNSIQGSNISDAKISCFPGTDKTLSATGECIQYGIYLDKATSVSISNVNIFESYYGIYVKKQCEGTAIIKSDVVNCNTGVYSAGSNTLIAFSHFNVSSGYVNIALAPARVGIGVDLTSEDESYPNNHSNLSHVYIISDCATAIGLYMKNVQYTLINCFRVLGTPSTLAYGIFIDGTGIAPGMTNGSRRNFISQVNIQNTTVAGIYIQTGVTFANVIYDVIFTDLAVGSATFLDNGPGGAITRDIISI